MFVSMRTLFPLITHSLLNLQRPLDQLDAASMLLGIKTLALLHVVKRPMPFLITTSFTFVSSRLAILDNQNSQFFGVRGNGITSRTLVMPVMNIISRSKPRPKPL